MNVIRCCALASALAGGALPAVAQTAQIAPAPMVVGLAPAGNPNMLRSGTPISLKMAETVTTKDNRLSTGYLAHLEVLEAVTVNGMTVIPAGSPAVAEVTEVRNKGMWGKSGRITARLMYVSVGDRRIRLSGVFDSKGTTGTAGVVAAVAFVPVAGFFTTGTSATLPLGAGVRGYIDEDVPLAVAAAPTRTR